VLQVYCDESGIHEGAAICAVAGWVGSARNWCLFEARWAKATDGIDFHSKEFFARDKSGRRVGAYKQFSDEDARQYLLGLLDAIERSDIRAVGAVIDVPAFQNLSLAERKWLTGATWNKARQRFTSSGSPDKPYYLGFIECLESAALSVKKHGMLVDFVFDQQNVLAPWALMFFTRTKDQDPSHMARKLGDAIFKSKAGVGALQAADMLASALYKHFSNSSLPPDFRPVTRTLEPFVKNRIARYFAPELERRAADLKRHVTTAGGSHS
jgi:hypothetical protein